MLLDYLKLANRMTMVAQLSLSWCCCTLQRDQLALGSSTTHMDKAHSHEAIVLLRKKTKSCAWPQVVEQKLQLAVIGIVSVGRFVVSSAFLHGQPAMALL